MFVWATFNQLQQPDIYIGAITCVSYLKMCCLMFGHWTGLLFIFRRWHILHSFNILTCPEWSMHPSRRQSVSVWVENVCMSVAELLPLLSEKLDRKSSSRLHSRHFNSPRIRSKNKHRPRGSTIADGTKVRSNETDDQEQHKPIPPCRIGHDLISCFPQRGKNSKGQPCLQPQGGISMAVPSIKPYPLHRLNRKCELFYHRLCIIRNSIAVQYNHFSTSKSATLSRYTCNILCRNNLFLISVLGNATVGLCWYIRSLFSWKPWATSANGSSRLAH